MCFKAVFVYAVNSPLTKPSDDATHSFRYTFLLVVKIPVIIAIIQSLVNHKYGCHSKTYKRNKECKWYFLYESEIII